ncbi:hypothetical protein C0995_009643 [Termitomyces sp. Mi166|nr:hypothetical protein C0995_009643 [Termitomyces sp. Mi166\
MDLLETKTLVRTTMVEEYWPTSWQDHDGIALSSFVNLKHSDSAHPHLITRQERQLHQIISIPGISCAPHRAEDCRQSAIWLNKCLDQLGAHTSLAKAKTLLSSAPSAAPKAKTKAPHPLLRELRCHPGPESRLIVGPVYSDSRTQCVPLPGAVATDEKGPIIAIACAVADLLPRRALECNLVFLIEGKEYERGVEDGAVVEAMLDIRRDSATGIALLDHRLSKFPGSEVLRKDLSNSTLVSTGDQALLACMNSAISKGVIQVAPSRVSFLETDVGVATLVLLRLLESDGPVNRSVFFKGYEFSLEVIQTAVESAKNYKEDACEVLYGRAGLLYALLRLRSAGISKARASNSTSADLEPLLTVLNNLTNNEVLRVVVDSIIDKGKEGVVEYAQLSAEPDQPMPPLMWTWHGTRYLGAAHGVAGILFVLWNCPFSVVEAYSGNLVKTLEWLVDLQDSTGNWPSKAPDGAADAEHKNELVHGIILDQTLREKINSAMRKGAGIVYRRGLLTKGVGICHGVAGSIYTLLATSRVLDSFTIKGGTPTDGNAKYLRRAAHLAVLAADFEQLTKNGEMRKPDCPWSLYEGSAGICYAWADVLCSLTGGDVGGVPGFDDF